MDTALKNKAGTGEEKILDDLSVEEKIKIMREGVEAMKEMVQIVQNILEVNAYVVRCFAEAVRDIIKQRKQQSD
ncbi:hypothetical protein HZA39_04055 [Candidatus Peregrinibacteria bacterium]|nr:hypothetical protein [Candidatus Peregrinibacteria bacterium]